MLAAPGKQSPDHLPVAAADGRHEGGVPVARSHDPSPTQPGQAEGDGPASKQSGLPCCFGVSVECRKLKGV
jgi:hypothetical protein